MSPFHKGALRSSAVLALVAVASGCAHVGQDEFNAEMETIRAEMTTADQRLDGRITENSNSVSALETRLDRVESDLQQLATEFDATVERLETALRFAAPVHFAFDDATVRSQDHEVLQRFASVVAEHYPDAVVTVEGFTDPSGSAAYNLRLGQRRAEAVKGVLVDAGNMNGAHIRTVSYGEDTSRLIHPSEQGPGTAGMANRRVVLVIDHGTAAEQPAVITDAGSAGSN